MGETEREGTGAGGTGREAEGRQTGLKPAPLDYAAFGNGRILGLVSPSASIDWLCLPRFDSPSVFARILDSERGGTFRVLAGGEEIRGELDYLRNTNVTRVRFQRGELAWEVIDFAPRLPEGLTTSCPVELVRLIRPLAGHPRLSLDLDARPDYARRQPTWQPVGEGLVLHGAGASVHVATNLPVEYLANGQEFTLSEPIFVSMHYGPRPSPATLATATHDLDVTVAGWRQWARTCALPTFAEHAVLRSALCLKLHASQDTGAIIAAATTSIPEAMGTERTWDYRYCWLRDAAFVAEALRRLSHLNEGEQLIRYIRDVVESGPLQPLYGIAGERDLEEHMLPHLAGFGGNGHVRIGNAAAGQAQHDLMGEVILCLDTMLSDPRVVHDAPESYYPLVRHLVELAIERAPTPDTGIWEYRSMLRLHTFSRAMCWVAMHRGAKLACQLGFQADAERWASHADAERETVLQRGYSATAGCFTQALDGLHPDASNLLLPTIGIVDARDPRFVTTVANYQQSLVRHGLTFRYLNADDVGIPTSAFTICSFWHAEALALTGRLEDAIETFNRLLHYANPVGLFSEDVDPETGALLGNFPQAYTHVGLIHAAMTIGELLEARDGRVRAWV